MFPTIVIVADEFLSVLSSFILDGNELEMKELLARFTTVSSATAKMTRMLSFERWAKKNSDRHATKGQWCFS